jgi:TolB protein
MTDTLPAGFQFDQMLSGSLSAPTVQGNKLIWTAPFDIPIGGHEDFSYRVLAYGAVDQAHVNSLQVAFDGQLSDPVEASVTVLHFYAYVPMIIREPSQAPSYRLAFDSKVTEEDGFEIWAVNANGSGRVNVSQNPGGDLDPDWSPDGTKIVWVHYEDGLGDIHAANADGSGETILSNHAKDEQAPAWSPDGNLIVFQRRVDVSGEVPFQLFWLDPANPGTKTQLTTGTRQSHDAVWSPDGNFIAYVWGYDEWAEICVMDVSSQASVCLTDNGIEDTAPAWSPDGTRLAYVSYQGGDSEIIVVDVTPPHDAYPLTNNAVNDYAPDWSPDGELIVYSTFMDSSYEIATIDVDTFVVTNLTNTGAGIADYTPKWSPDGSLILFLSNRDGPKDLYVMGADGVNPPPYRLTETSSDESIYVWKSQ